jgi:hypothetical protein
MAFDSRINSYFNLYRNNEVVSKHVESVVVHLTVTKIRQRTFKDCNLMKSIHIPNSVSEIGNNAFLRCTSLISINIPNSIEEIQHETFRHCTSLSSIDIPHTVRRIGNDAFDNCISLTSINIPHSVIEIGRSAFRYCTSLTSINIPNSVTRIGTDAFYKCTLLTLIAIPQPVTLFRYDDRFSVLLEQRKINCCNYHYSTDKWLRQRFDNLPLHQVLYNSSNTMTITLLAHIIQQHNSTMFISTDAMLMTPLHVLCCNTAVTFEMIRMLKAACPDAVSMRNVLDETPLMMYLKCKKKEYYAYHVNGQLSPLVKLLELGIEYELLEVIWILYDEVMFLSELAERSEVSGLFPFMYGASLADCGLDVVYELAMKRQDLLVGF